MSLEKTKGRNIVNGLDKIFVFCQISHSFHFAGDGHTDSDMTLLVGILICKGQHYGIFYCEFVPKLFEK